MYSLNTLDSISKEVRPKAPRTKSAKVAGQSTVSTDTKQVSGINTPAGDVTGTVGTSISDVASAVGTVSTVSTPVSAVGTVVSGQSTVVTDDIAQALAGI